MKCKYLPVKYHDMVKDFPSFSQARQESHLQRRTIVM